MMMKAGKTGRVAEDLHAEGLAGQVLRGSVEMLVLYRLSGGDTVSSSKLTYLVRQAISAAYRRRGRCDPILEAGHRIMLQATKSSARTDSGVTGKVMTRQAFRRSGEALFLHRPLVNANVSSSS